MNKNMLVLLIAIVIIVAGAFWLMSDPASDADVPIDTTSQSPATSGDNLEPGSQAQDLPIEPVAVLARADLAAKLSVEEKNIVIIKITEETWTDGCLGLGGPAESCLQALVPGFRVEMLASGKTYFYRTDKTGSAIRAEMQ